MIKMVQTFLICRLIDCLLIKFFGISQNEIVTSFFFLLNWNIDLRHTISFIRSKLKKNYRFGIARFISIQLCMTKLYRKTIISHSSQRKGIKLKINCFKQCFILFHRIEKNKMKSVKHTYILIFICYLCAMGLF